MKVSRQTVYNRELKRMYSLNLAMVSNLFLAGDSLPHPLACAYDSEAYGERLHAPRKTSVRAQKVHAKRPITRSGSASRASCFRVW